MTPMTTKERMTVQFNIGDRVFHRRFKTREGNEHGGVFGVVIALPPERGGAPSIPNELFAVVLDDGSVHGIHPTLLERCDDCEAGEGLRIAVARLREKREGLFHDMVCLVAATRRIDLRDPRVRMQIEAEVRRMSASWGDADAERLRRKELFERPELRTRFTTSVTAYLKAGDLIQQLMGLIDGDSS